MLTRMTVNIPKDMDARIKETSRTIVWGLHYRSYMRYYYKSIGEPMPEVVGFVRTRGRRIYYDK